MIGNIIDFQSFDGGTDYFINQRGAQPRMQAETPFYYISLDTVEGLFSSDISYESHPVPQLNEERSGDVFRKGKSLTLSGTIYGHALSYLFQGAYYLESMFAETKIRKLYFRPWNLPTGDDPVYMNCRVNQDLAIVQSFTGGRMEWPWVVGLRSDDGVTWSAEDVVWVPPTGV